MNSKRNKEQEPARKAIRDLPSALDNYEEIIRIFTGHTPAVFLDYDGTLTPIVDEPVMAVLPEETRGVLVSLASRCTVVVVSGRDLNDVKMMVAVKGIAYVGSHGFDIVAADGTHHDDSKWQHFLPELDSAEAKLKKALKDIPGARVERKRFAIAVHYRMVDSANINILEQVFDRIAAQHPLLQESGGKKIFELRPNVEWDKGQALLSILDTLGLGINVVPLFIGDDVTDEDAFKAIHDIGIGIAVGDDERLTAARYALANPKEVREFLKILVSSLRDKL